MRQRQDRSFPATVVDEARGALEARRDLLIAAPSGYGKTHLLFVLARQVQAAHTIATLDDVRDAVAAGDDAVLIIDHLTLWEPADVAQLTRLLLFEARVPPVAVATRYAHPDIVDALALRGAHTIGVDELRFRVPVDESRDAPSAGAALVERVADGWPRLGHLLLEALDTDPTGVDISVAHPIVQEVVEARLAELADDDVRALEQLSFLDSFTPKVVRRLGSGLAERLDRGGVPIERTADRGLRLIAPVRETLRRRSSADPDLIRSLASELDASGRPLDAARALVRIGDADTAALLLAGADKLRLDAAPVQDLIALLELLDRHVDTSPRLHLVRARTYGNAAMIDEQSQALRDAAARAEQLGDESLRLAAVAEQLHVRAMLAEAPPDELLASVAEAEQHDVSVETSIRLLDAKSLALAQSTDRERIDDAIQISSRIVQAWETLGDETRAAAALRARIMAMLLPDGRLSEADSSLARALRYVPANHLERLSTLVVAVLLDGINGRDEPARLSECSALADALDLKWAHAYVYWAAALQAAARRDLPALQRSARHARHFIEPLGEHPTGALLLCDLVEAFSRAGDAATAQSLLAEVSARRDQCRPEFAFAELAVLTRRPGADIDASVRATAEVIESRPALAWKTSMYRAVAASTSGDDAEAVRWTAVATTEADRWCGRGIIERLEPSLFRDVAPTATTTSAEPSGTTPTSRVRILGGFEVSHDGGVAEYTSRRSYELIRTVALGRGRAPIEVVTDRLWPDVLDDVGRRRLKNVLARTRHEFGPIVERDGDHLVLTDDVVLDLVEFDDAHRRATMALANHEPEAVAEALRALDLYRGPLLPDDLYDDTVARVRIAEAARAMTLVDGLLATSRNPVLAPTLLDALLRIDANDLLRFEQLVEWARENGSVGVARSAALQAAAIAAELYVELQPGTTEFLSTRDLEATGFGDVT